MKIFQSSIFRALCAIVIGVLLIKKPDEGATWITQAIGVLFLVSGVIALIAYWHASKHASEYTVTDKEGHIISGGQPTFPIVGAGSVILGLVLALTPNVVVKVLMYILGAIMILGGINQLINLIAARRLGRIAPSIILLTGLFVVLKPMESAELPLLILGWCSLLYGATELINALKIRSVRKAAERNRITPDTTNGEPVAEEISSQLGTESIEEPAEEPTEQPSDDAAPKTGDADEYDDFSAD